MGKHAELCPVCEGKGYIEEWTTVTSQWDSTDGIGQGTVRNCQRKVCHGCNGKGWVEVDDGCDCPPTHPPYQPWYPWWENPTYIPWVECDLSDTETIESGDELIITYSIPSNSHS